jgi:hypothetical protein
MSQDEQNSDAEGLYVEVASEGASTEADISPKWKKCVNISLK